MRFSIVIPVYNVERYLAGCLDSVIGQTYKDFQIVLVNDGSTDSSGEICRDFKSRHDGMTKLIEQENKGLLLARRAGFAQADGDIIMSLDSDDKLRSDALERVSAAFDRTGADIVCFEGSRNERFEINGSPLFHGEQLFSGEGKAEALLKLCSDFRFFSIWSKAISRKVLDIDADYTPYHGLSFGEDLLQMVSVFDAASSIVYIPDVLYYYRPNPNSLVQHFREKNFDDMVRAREKLGRFASVWDGRYPGFGYLTHADAVSLHEVALLTEQAAICFSVNDLCDFVDRVRFSDFFRKAYGNSDARRLLRPDVRMVAWAIRFGVPSAVRSVARLKSAVLADKRY